ncbi:MAG: polyprenyl synthetase family protein [Myxococcota bacterium]
MSDSAFPRAARFLDESRARIERHLSCALPPAEFAPKALHEAMRYAVLSGGKRLRPALSFATAKALRADPESVLPVAAAVELVHAYSLVHDDLPAMDDDRERRGQPTVHVKFGESIAILCGDALLAEAFGQLARPEVPHEVIAELAAAAGSRALVGGQADDLRFRPELDAILSIHERKTGALFRFAVCGAARLLQAPRLEHAALEGFACAYGRAFQLIDDLEDDAAGECSILRVLEPSRVRERAACELREALACLDPLGECAGALRAVGESLAGRLT